MEKNVWLITAKTNLHVGNENTSNYGIIDKSIQRDALTGLPCINASSLKGAINEYFTVKKEKDPIFLKNVFGGDKKEREKETKKGGFAFFDAHILFIPVQGQTELFYWVTADSVLKEFSKRVQLFGIECESEPAEIVKKLKPMLGNQRIERVSEQEFGKFKEYCDDDNLPIIARNKLDNGESANLWYEQVLPQETVFYSLTLGSKEDLSIKEDLNNAIVQIGANATIGYGYCEFKLVNT